jgi:hypothetical protein
MNWKIAAPILLILITAGYAYGVSATGEYQPLGRLGFVKFKNPDMAQGNPHSVLIANYTKDRGSNTALVVHFAGHTTGYPCYEESGVLIEELGFQDLKNDYKENNTINWLDDVKVFLFGVPDGRYRYVSDGIVFDNLDDALNYLDKKAAQYGKVGKTVLVWHGTARVGNPMIMQGCGYPLYFQLVWHEYGRIAAYYYLISGMIFPYYSDPYALAELQNAQQLQYLYNKGALDDY